MNFNLLHEIGVFLGFGGAAISCALMMFVKTNEKRFRRGKIARRICVVTWTGLLLIIYSGIALTLGKNINYNTIFAFKHLCVIIITVDASIIHFWLFPRYFHQIGTPDWDKTYMIMRRIGALSMTCWIITIILSAFI